MVDNSQILLIVGNDADIERYRESEHIPELDRYYEKYLEGVNKYHKDKGSIFEHTYQKYEEYNTNFILIEYPTINEDENCNSLNMVGQHITRIMDKYPKLYFIWETTYNNEEVGIYLINDGEDTQLEDRCIRNNFREMLPTIISHTDTPFFKKNLRNILIGLPDEEKQT